MKRYIIISVLFVLGVSGGYAQSTSDIESYIAEYKELALKHEEEYGIPASIKLAQGILESGAGKSGLTQKSNNHFGIKKGNDWTGALYYAWDDDLLKSPFRCYSSAAESFRDHSLFLKNNNRYRKLFSKSVYDYRGWAWGLQNAGYASARNYAKALIGFIDAYKLYSINGGVKLRPGKTVIITRYITKEQPVFDTDCRLDDSEETEEEENVTKAIKRFVVEINHVRCTILYPGESLASISQKYDVPKNKILKYNEISHESDINEGDIVFLEKKKTKYGGAQDHYIVKERETLYDVSQMFGIKLSCLTKMNNKNLFSALKIGESLRLK